DLNDEYVTITFNNGMKKEFLFQDVIKNNFIQFINKQLIVESKNQNIIVSQSTKVNNLKDMLEYDDFKKRIISTFKSDRLLWEVIVEYFDDDKIYENLRKEVLYILGNALQFGIAHGFKADKRAIV